MVVAAQAVPQPAQIINLGHVEVWSVPDEPTPLLPAPDASKLSPATVVTSRPTSLEEARAVVGFALVFPNWLPEGLALAQVQMLTLPNVGSEITLIFRNPSGGPTIGGVWEVVIHQRRWAGTPRIMMPRLFEGGIVANRPAIFWTAVGRDFAMFEWGDLLITIDGARLTREELVGIAESLAEVPRP